MKKFITPIFAALIATGISAKTYNDNEVKQFTDWFVALASIDSQSTCPEVDSSVFPLNPGQREIADYVVGKLNELYPKQIASGKLKVEKSPTEYVYINIPGNAAAPSLMMMAHLDVTPEAPGGKVTPIVHANHDGRSITLPAGISLDTDDPRCARLKDCVGKTVITSDGTTLLGADDKSGCTVLLGVLDKIMNGKQKHGDIYIVFSQNEDIGMAADGFDLSYVGGKSPDIVIDVDGGSPETFTVGNFTAPLRHYIFRGNNVHPAHGKEEGYADALAAATAFMGQISPTVHPGATEGSDGYIHCFSLVHPKDATGKEIDTDYVVSVRLRYFDKAEGDSFREMIDRAEAYARAGYPLVKIEAIPEVMQYENIAYTMHPALPDIIQGLESVSLTPTMERGGTTSAMMAAKGLIGGPCIFSGQQAEHSCYEWVCVEDMIDMSNAVLEIIDKVSQLNK